MQEGIEERGGVFYIVCVQQRRGKRRGKQLFVVASTRYVCAVCNDVLYTARAVCRSRRNGDGGEFPYLLCPPLSLYLPFHAAWSVGLTRTDREVPSCLKQARQKMGPKKPQQLQQQHQQQRSYEEDKYLTASFPGVMLETTGEPEPSPSSSSREPRDLESLLHRATTRMECLKDRKERVYKGGFAENQQCIT